MDTPLTAHQPAHPSLAPRRAAPSVRRLANGLAAAGRRLRGDLRRSLVLVVFAALNNPASLFALGALNRRFGFLQSLFVCYPASTRFARHVVFDFALRRLKWRPAIYGVFVQGGRLGLLLCTSTTEKELARPANRPRNRLLQRRIEELRERLAVPHVSLSGVLPHYVSPELRRKAATRGEPGPVADLVVAARERIAAQEELAGAPVIVLGGLGRIGTEVVARLRADGVECHAIDKRPGADPWPSHLRGRPCLLIDVARKGVLREHAELLWEELVVLNETYPEPRGAELRRLTDRGVRVYHVVGVRGTALPAFPDGYRGGIPCCAMHRPDRADVLVTELS